VTTRFGLPVATSRSDKDGREGESEEIHAKIEGARRVEVGMIKARVEGWPGGGSCAEERFREVEGGGKNARLGEGVAQVKGMDLGVS
jgi:hypothetical protein